MSTGGLSKARLGRMHDVTAGHVERGGVPGMVTLVSRRGEVHVDAMGMKAAGGPEATRNAPMRRDTIFRISSMTKPITAAAAMILVEECKLRLDEPVDRLLPELADRKVLTRLDGPLDNTVPAMRPITVRDLLTFHMGFGIVMAPPDATPIQKAIGEQLLGQGPPSPSTTPAPDEWIRRLGTLPLMHQPGEKWMYHTGSDVLGVLIARAFLVPAPTMAQRLVRAKAKIRTARIPYQVPPDDALAERLDAVMVVVYLVFNEGYAASFSERLVRHELCEQAIRLGRMLVELLPAHAETQGLLALMLLHDSRRETRLDGSGDIERGLAMVDEIDHGGELAGYHLLPAARAELLRRLGRHLEAAESYRRALALVSNEAERRHLEERLREIVS